MALNESIRTLPKRQGKLFISDLVEIYNTIIFFFCYLNFINNFKEKERKKAILHGMSTMDAILELKKAKKILLTCRA